MNIYDFKVKDIENNEVNLSEYNGKVLLIVNVASKCGFTPQYDGLQELYEKYKDKGFEILAFPCNQFGEQEPGSDNEIKNFCTDTFGIDFKLFSKIDVNGENEEPLYKYLKSQKEFKGFDLDTKIGPLLDKMYREKDPNYISGNDIMWNFTKFLIDKNGQVLERFEPTTEPIDLEDEIVKIL